MKFSVIIPLYNGARFIWQTLDSVTAQTYTDYEIIMVNDGSPDRVGEVAQKYIAEHPGRQFVYLEQKNRGLGAARNTAIRNSTGEVLALLDQDDLWYPDKLEEVHRAMRADPRVDYVGHHEAVRKNGEIIRTACYGPVGDDFFRQLLFDRNCLSTSASCFKKEVMDRVGYFSENREQMHFVEDYDLWLRMALAGCRFQIIDKVLGEYRLHDDNYSSLSFSLMYAHEMNTVKKNWVGLRDKTIRDHIRLACRTAKIRLAKTKDLLAGIKRLIP